MAEIHILPDHGAAVVYPEEHFAELIRTGGLSPSVLYWREGMTDWELIGTYRPRAAAPEGPAQPVPTATQPGPLEDGKAASAGPSSSTTSPVVQATPATPVTKGVDAGSPSRSHYRFRRNPWPLTIILELGLSVCLVLALIQLVQAYNNYETVGTPTLAPPPTLQIAWTAPSGASKPDDADLMEARSSGSEDTPVTTDQMLEWSGWAANLLLLVPYLMWLHRTTINCRFVSPTMRVNPSSAVACYFIPFVNLFRPFQDMQEIWRVSGNPRGWLKDRGSILVGIWWVLALGTVGTSIECSELFATIHSPDDAVFATLFFVIQKSIQVSWYLSFILLVAMILHRLTESLAKLRRGKLTATR
jgi:hypothetical protein